MSRPHLRPFEPGDRVAIEAMAREVVDDGVRFAYEDVPGVLGYWMGQGTATFVAVDGEAVLGTYAPLAGSRRGVKVRAGPPFPPSSAPRPADRASLRSRPVRPPLAGRGAGTYSLES